MNCKAMNIYISSCDKQGGIYRFELKNGKLLFKDKTALDRPMYTVYKDGKLWVIVREAFENEIGGVMSFDVAEDGTLVNPSPVTSTNGICPCHLCVTDNDVYFVNYDSGNVTSISGKIDTHLGIGVNQPRQDMPHTHYINVSPDGKYLLSCDLGLDRIYTYDFDLNVVSVAKVPEGHGARHLAYSPDGKYVYCANELGATVCVFAYDDGKLNLGKIYTTLGRDVEENTVAAIRVHDGHLYVSNRGEETVVCFKIIGDSLELESRTDVAGSFPRDFDIVDGHLICTNEHTDNVTVFKLEDGKLTQTDSVENIADPLCITAIYTEA